MNKQVFCENRGNVLWVKIDNPQTCNGLNWEGINQLADCFEGISEDAVKAVVITGNEDYFYTGGRVDGKAAGAQSVAKLPAVSFISAVAAVTEM